jgi:branched-chain amino acid transport system permease protein
MEHVALFALLGLGGGALIAGIALGVVLTYRGSGIINIGTGAVAMLAGYAYWSINVGRYGGTVDPTICFVGAIVFSALVGVLVELVCFRPLRTAAPLGKLVASLGILLLAQAAVTLAFGNDPQVPAAFLPSQTVQMLGGVVPIENFILVGIVVAAAIALSAVYRWTRFGLATRAAAENEVSGMLIGLSPNALSMVNTVLASVVAGTLGVLAGNITSLDPVNLPLQVVPALAAAIFAGFTSFWIACACGLGIGVLQNILYYLSTRAWFPKVSGLPIPGVDDLLVFVIMAIALYARGARLPTRGELVERRLPFVPKARRIAPGALVGGLLCAAALVILPYDFREALITTLIGAVLCLSYVVITGYVGQVSVAQLAISGVTGFIMSRLAEQAGIGFPIGPLIGIVAATMVGVIVAFSALRVRGVSLAIITLAGAVAIQNFWFNNSNWGETAGGSPVPQPSLLGLKLGTAAPFRGLDGQVPSPVFGFVVVLFTVLACMLVANIRRGKLGQRMLAVRSNERAAAASGINVRNVKLIAFTIGSFLAGVGGALTAYNSGSLSSAQFTALNALGVIAYAYIGGITMVTGALFAGAISADALFPHALQVWFGISGTWAIMLAGFALISTLIFSPEGAIGTAYRKQMERRRRVATGLARPSRMAALLAPASRGAEEGRRGWIRLRRP